MGVDDYMVMFVLASQLYPVSAFDMPLGLLKEK